MWHVSSRSGVATLRTAIHLLLNYSHDYSSTLEQRRQTMSTYCVYVLKVASIDGLMPFLAACDCTIFIVNLLFVICKKVKVAHTRFTERTVPELIPVLGSQPAGDVSHKPGGRLPLLSARPAVTPATLKRAATNFATW